MISLDYGTVTVASGADQLIDLTRDQSIVLSKNHEYTTRDGHLKGVLCDITVSGANGAVFEIYGMPNTWKLRNGMRKFHFLRNHMFKESGITKSEMGKYGKTIRPYLDTRHASGSDSTELDPVYRVHEVAVGTGDMTPTKYTGGEWTRSTFATVPLYETGAGAGPETNLPPVDEWSLKLANANSQEAVSVGAGSPDTITYTSVGVVHSYNLDRQAVQVQTTQTSLDGPSNPLAALASSGNQATGEILDIAEIQEEEAPPYSLKDDGESTALVQLDRWAFPSTYGATHVFRNVFIPAGMFRIGSSANEVDFDVRVDVIANVECRDMA